MTVKELEASLVKNGFCRSPNNWQSWYRGCSAFKRPAYPLEIRLPNQLWIAVKNQQGEWVYLMQFATVEQLIEYLDRNGVIVEAGANVWD